MVKTKICSRCGEEKPLSAFHYRKDSRDLHRGVCKDCINASLRAARWRKAHPVELVRHIESAKPVDWHPRDEPERAHNYEMPVTCYDPVPARKFLGDVLASILRRLR